MEEQDIDTSTHSRPSTPLTPEQRAKKQQTFLKLYRECANIKASCKAAGINRQTFYNWRDNDSEFAAQLPEADKDADDTAEFALYDRAIKGVESYVVSNGRVVYLDDKPLKERKYSDGLLTTLLKARMPEKYKDKQHVEHSGGIDITGARDSLMGKLAAFAKPKTDETKPE
jgi:hypothetical protein